MPSRKHFIEQTNNGVVHEFCTRCPNDRWTGRWRHAEDTEWQGNPTRCQHAKKRTQDAEKAEKKAGKR